MPHPREVEIPVAPVHGGTLSPRWADPGRSCVGWMLLLCPSPPLSLFCVPHPTVTACPPALPSQVLTVDDDAQQEGNEEEEDGTHQSHAEPGELAVSVVPPACLAPELPACGKARKVGRARVLLAIPLPCHLPARLAEVWLGTSRPLVPGVLVGPLSGPRALRGKLPHHPAPRPAAAPGGPVDRGVCTNPQAGTEAIPGRRGAGPLLVWWVLGAWRCLGLLTLEDGVAELSLQESKRGWHHGEHAVGTRRWLGRDP